MPISDLGTPSEDHLFAVFATPQQADEAAEDLAELGVPVHRFEGPQAAQALMGPDTGVGEPMAMLRRVLRGMSEQTHEAERYAQHLDHGDVVLSLPAENHAVAVLLSRILTRHGGFDITFFDNLTYEHFGPPSPPSSGTATGANPSEQQGTVG